MSSPWLSRGRWLGAAALAVAVTAPAKAALADEAVGPRARVAKSNLQDARLPPDVEARRDEIGREVREKPLDKAGPFMAVVKGGPSVGLNAPSALAVELDLGYAFIKGNGQGIAQGDLYGVVTPQVQVGTGLVLTLPVGVQYDVPTPIAGLYVYPRTVVGYAAILDPGDGNSGDAFAIIPAAGVKFVPNPNFNIGFEPFSMPIHVGNGSPGVQYRMLGFAGFNL